MVASQNGWRANDRSVISTRNVPGTNVRLAVRNGSPGDLLLEVAAKFHREVENIQGPIADDWGYAERNIRGSSTTVSNHASGTAIDLNAPRHPLGKSGTFSPQQTAAIRRIIAQTGNVVRWGGDYTGRKDEMHFEINDGRTEADCSRALAALRGTSVPTPVPPPPASSRPELKYGVTGALVGSLINFANRVFPGYGMTPISILNPPFFGPGTQAFVKEFQTRSGLTADGIVGPKTWAALERAGFKG